MAEFAVPIITGSTSTRSIDESLAAAAQAVRSDRALCEELVHEIGRALRGTRDIERIATLDQIHGTLLMSRGDLAGATQRFQSARRGWLAAGRPLEAHLATLGRTHVMTLLGDFTEVRQIVEELQVTLDDLEGLQGDPASILHLLAHLQLGEAVTSLEGWDAGAHHYDTAEDLAWDVGDIHLVGEVACRRGNFLLGAGLHQRAVVELIRARRAFLDAGSAASAADVLILIAECVVGLGDVSGGMLLLRAAETACTANPWAAGERDVILACALLRSGLAAEALELARAAEETFITMGLMLRSARAAFVAGIALIRLGRLTEADEELTVVEQLYGGTGAVVLRDTARLYRARLAIVTGDHATAGRLATQLAGPVDDAPTALRHIGARARLLLAEISDDPAEAERLIEEAAPAAARLSDRQLRLELRLARARHLRSTGRRAESRTQLRSALELGRLHSSRNLCGTDGTGRFPWQQAADELVAALVEDGGHAGLIEAWQRSHAGRVSALDPVIQQARSMLARTEAAEAASPDAADLLDEADLEALLDSARAASVTPMAVPDPVPVPEGPLLDYYVLGDDVLVFVIRDGLVHAHRLPRVATTARHLVRAWQQECRLAAVVPPQEGMATSPALDGLFTALVEPLADLLTDLEPGRIEVMLDDQLHAVPFEALLDLGGPWRRRLGLADAATVPLEAVADRDEAPPITALVLAVPDERAPKIAVEATMVASTLLKSEVFVGDDATARVLAERGRDVDVVHVAAHGEFRGGNPLFSAVQLGDGWLRAVDLVDGDLHLDGALVVLSACGTGRTTSPQPQPLSLAWAFLDAGAGGVIAALWDVDDRVTLQLMSHLYRRLAAGEHPREALSAARREVAASFPHPYHWAPFRYFALG